MKKLSAILFSALFLLKLTAQVNQNIGIGNLIYFERAYPDLTFTRHFNISEGEWIITVKIPDTPGDKDGPGKTFDFYWANGSFLPEDEFKNKENYWSLLYGYQKELADPANYSEEQREQIKNFSSKESRKNGAGTPMFFFDALYNSSSRRSLEQHISRISFLGNKTNVHERMVKPLKNVEEKIFALAKTDSEVKAFLDNLKSNDAYYHKLPIYHPI